MRTARVQPGAFKSNWHCPQEASTSYDFLAGSGPVLPSFFCANSSVANSSEEERRSIFFMVNLFCQMIGKIITDVFILVVGRPVPFLPGQTPPRRPSNRRSHNT